MVGRLIFYFTGAVFLWATPRLGFAQAPRENVRLVGRLDAIHVEVMELQERLLSAQKSTQQTQTNLKYIRALLKLQKEERELGRRRIQELETTVKELESRREILRSKIVEHRKSMHRLLVVIEKGSPAVSGVERIESLEIAPLAQREKIEAPRRKVLANLVSRGLKEMEVMKIDLADADKLEARIQEEKQQLVYLFQDLDEKEGVLQLNQQLQVDLLRRNEDERLAQLENYRKLKSAETQVQQMIEAFNSRKELERTEETERLVSRAMTRSAFAGLKGRLPLPVSSGKILSTFGRAYDPQSKLYIFKKGVDILSGKGEAVKAISAGKIAYSGELPSYGKVTIVDHGDHFYSLCAHLGSLDKKAGEAVAAGDTLGLTDDTGTPVYFEIRARNVAVNPLNWISN